VIDTALVYDHPRGRPFKPSLRWLAEQFLQRTIQAGEHGHDSVEDARTALALVQLKLRSPPGFGEHRTATESLFVRLARHGRRVAMVDSAALVHAHARPPADARIATSDYEVNTWSTGPPQWQTAVG
jgi:RNA exonuclease 1